MKKNNGKDYARKIVKPVSKRTEKMYIRIRKNEIIRMINGEKTEINVSVFHNEAYLGCAHREMTKDRYFSGRKGKGFVLWKFHGEF